MPLMSRAAGFSYAPLLPTGDDLTDYRLVTDEGVDVVNGPGGRRFLTVEPAALTQLTAEAMHDIAHFLRPAHLTQLRSIIDDPTILVSKPQATITLAKIVAKKNPAEARKLLEPLRAERGPVSRAAITALGEMPAAR